MASPGSPCAQRPVSKRKGFKARITSSPQLPSQGNHSYKDYSARRQARCVPAALVKIRVRAYCSFSFLEGAGRYLSWLFALPLGSAFPLCNQ